MPSWTKMRKAYYKAFSDEMMTKNLIDVVTEIIEGKWPDDSPMGVYTVGGVRATIGFYASKAMIEELLAALTGRSIRALCTALNVSPFEPNVMKLLIETNTQTARCIDPIYDKLIAKFGVPAKIDQDKIDDLTSRAHRMIHPNN
jgi:hypothetical protein